MRKLVFWLVVFSGLLCCEVSADQITMKNGDRLTGKIASETTNQAGIGSFPGWDDLFRTHTCIYTRNVQYADLRMFELCR